MKQHCESVIELSSKDPSRFDDLFYLKLQKFQQMLDTQEQLHCSQSASKIDLEVVSDVDSYKSCDDGNDGIVFDAYQEPIQILPII
jgi:hypothetical protein